MPAILIYLLKVNIALLLFCLCYYAVLRRLTFYTLNRVYLITAILFSSIYPLIDFTALMQQHRQLVQPIQVIVIDLNIRAAHFAKPVAQTNYWEWLVALFWLGVVIMALRLVMQFISLLRIHRRSTPASIDHYKVRIIDDEANPFSFWQSIYINPRQHSTDELQAIIAHEQVHVSQWHTLDILLAEISLVFYWFNPGVWLMKRAVAENLEFITDRKILQQGIDAKSYQYSLLYASFNTSPNAIVNHFNISTIKKRIMMMNSKRSSAYSLSRYGLIAPAVLALVLVFGTTKAELLKKGARAAQKATEKAISVTGSSINTVTSKLSETKAAKILNNVQENAEKLASYVTGQDTGIKLTHLQFSSDTPKYKAATKLRFSGPDTGYYLIDGKKASSQELLGMYTDDIVSFNMIGAQSSAKIFGKNVKNGGVLIVTKYGQNTAMVKALMKKINAIKAMGKPSETGIVDIKPAKGTLKSISITTSESAYKNVPGYTSTTYHNIGERERNSKGKVEVKIEQILSYPQSGSILRKDTAQGKAISATDVTKSIGITHDITAKKVFDEATGITISDIYNPNPPLFYIDGKASTATAMNSLKQNEIESISVLKDASATALYGEKGKNGVILVTTKEGAQHQPQTNPIKLGKIGAANPLYIVDDKPKEGNPMETIDLSTIKTIEVHKDIATTAFYGEKGKDGVILITTKDDGRSKKKN
jgi:bla regulator protein BlaR1